LACLLLRRPRCPPPFPYTTLFRSAARLDRSASRRARGGLRHAHRGVRDLEDAVGRDQPLPTLERRHPAALRRRPTQYPGPVHIRSEEHTSELQSLAYLVCRLLLEK